MNAGVYVHLPYCASRCSYCAFVVTTDDSSRDAYLEALERELELVRGTAKGWRFDSVYLGGGTPSRIPSEGIRRLLEAIRSRFEVEPGSEVTLEANPEDVTEANVGDWIACGISRVSVGVQSFVDAELAAIGRRHDALRARAALETLTETGLSVSGDLILGLPEQTQESFRRNVDRLVQSGVDHVSVYLLEAEKSKTIEEDRRSRPDRYLSDDAQAESWLDAGTLLGRAGLEHYEVSNWARPGRAARHNLKYWERTPTLGIGVSAHEFWQGRRRSNLASLPAYIDRIHAGERPLAADRLLGPDESAAERIVLGLRLSRGVERDEVESWIDGASDPRLAPDFAAWLDSGLLQEREGRIAFSEEGFLVSNEILCRFV